MDSDRVVDYMSDHSGDERFEYDEEKYGIDEDEESYGKKGQMEMDEDDDDDDDDDGGTEGDDEDDEDAKVSRERHISLH